MNPTCPQRCSPWGAGAEAEVLGDISNGADAPLPPPQVAAAPAADAGADEVAALRARVRQLELAQGLMERELDSMSVLASQSNAQLRCAWHLWQRRGLWAQP